VAREACEIRGPEMIGTRSTAMAAFLLLSACVASCQIIPLNPNDVVNYNTLNNNFSWLQFNKTQWRGAYNPSTSFVQSDVVSYANALYSSLSSGNVGHQPDISGSYWQLMLMSSAGGSGYATIQANGSTLTQRTIVNFIPPLLAVDNSGSSRTDVSCQVASGSQPGCLASADWATFNGKQNALTNPITGTGTTGTLTKFIGGGAIGNATSGTDFAPATSGVAILKGNNAGGFAAAVGGTDYVATLTSVPHVVANASFGTYTVQTTDFARLVYRSEASAAATDNLQAASTYGAGFWFSYECQAASCFNFTLQGGSDVMFGIPSAGIGKGTGVTIWTDGVHSFYALTGSNVISVSGAGAPAINCSAPSSVSISFYTDTTAHNLYFCSQLNTWVLLSGGGGSTNVTITSGASDPSGSCTGSTTSMLYVYLQTTLNTKWFCDSGGHWQKDLSVPGSGPYAVYGSNQSQSAAVTQNGGSVASGSTLCFFDSTKLTEVCLDTLLNPYQMVRVWSGTITVNPGALSANSCNSTPITASLTGVLSTDTVTLTPNASIKAVTGYTPAGTVTIVPYLQADALILDVCNKDQANPVTPTSITLNYRVSR